MFVPCAKAQWDAPSAAQGLCLSPAQKRDATPLRGLRAVFLRISSRLFHVRKSARDFLVPFV